MFVCPRCGNKNEKYIGYLNGKPYCRRCISMNGESAKEYKSKGGAVVLNLGYPLSDEQKRISDRLIENYENTLVSIIGFDKFFSKLDEEHKMIFDSKDELMQYKFAKEISLMSVINEAKIKRDVVTIVSQVLVDKNDPMFKNPTKPVGAFYDKETAEGGDFISQFVRLYKSNGGNRLAEIFATQPPPCAMWILAVALPSWETFMVSVR